MVTLPRFGAALASFSSAGPTYEAFVKPEVIAPGGHMLGLMDRHSRIALEHSELHDQWAYFTMSGTSQAAAAVSGIAALMLQVDPSLTPDDVKFVAPPFLRHRLLLKPEAEIEGLDADAVIQRLLGLVEVPR